MRGFEAVYTQRVGELTAMVEVMLDHVPDDPPAGEGICKAPGPINRRCAR